MDPNLIEIMEGTVTRTRYGCYVIQPLYTPCCMAGSTLRGKPAPQYHCNDCGQVFTSLAEFKVKEKPDG